MKRLMKSRIICAASPGRRRDWPTETSCRARAIQFTLALRFLRKRDAEAPAWTAVLIARLTPA
jgi:hypothetical protein